MAIVTLPRLQVFKCFVPSALRIKINLFLLFVVMSQFFSLSLFILFSLLDCFFHQILFRRSEHRHFLTKRLVPTPQIFCFQGQAFAISGVAFSKFHVVILKLILDPLRLLCLDSVLELFNFNLFLLFTFPHLHDAGHSAFARICNLLLNLFIFFNSAFVCHTLRDSLLPPQLIDLLLSCSLFLL